MVLGLAVLALLSSLAWGSSDFVGALASRKLAAPAVVLWSQALALVVLSVAMVALRLPPSGPWLLPAIGAGAAGALALTCYYAALASGTMGVVAPIASLGVMVPVAVGISAGDRASALAWGGVVIAVAGVVLASGPELSGAGHGMWRPVLLAAIAGVGFGVTMVLLAHGAEHSLVSTLWGMRLTSTTAFTVFALVARPSGWGNPRPVLPSLAFVAVADALANALFAFAASRGLVSLAGVLGSVYPAVTILLARLVLDERLRPVQVVGVVLTMVGVAAISLG